MYKFSLVIALPLLLIMSSISAAPLDQRKQIPVQVQMHDTALPDVGLHVGISGHKNHEMVKTNRSGFAMFPRSMEGEIVYIYAVSFGLDKHGYRLMCRHGDSKPVPIRRGDVLKYFPTEYCEVMLNQLDLTPHFPDEAGLDVDFPASSS